MRGEQVQVQVLIDGSDSQVATTALNTAQLLGLNLSIQSARTKGEALNIAPARDPMGHAASARSKCEPDCSTTPTWKSSHLLCPGLVGIILQLVTLFLTSFADRPRTRTGHAGATVCDARRADGTAAGQTAALCDGWFCRSADRSVGDDLRVRRADQRQHRVCC